MERKCVVVCVVVLSALVTHRVEAFGLDNIIRALEARDLKTTTREIKEPSDVLVSVALEVLDTNHDRKIAISEVRNILDRYGEFVGYRYWDVEAGYFVTLATIADGDDSGFIEENEYQRAATVFVEQTNLKEVRTMVTLAVDVLIAIHGMDTVVESSITMVIDALDRDGDGEISEEERRTLLSFRRLHHWLSGAINAAIRFDNDNDGSLNEAEARTWLEVAKTSTSDVYQKLLVYAKITSLGGRDMADTLADS